MTTEFIEFPGTAGNSISTDSVNLLDADTAHLAQSIGLWVQGTSSAVTYLPNSGDYGAFNWRLTSGIIPRVITSGLSVPVSAGDYTITMTVDNKQGTDRAVAVRLYVDGGSNGSEIPVLVPGESTISVTISLPSGNLDQIFLQIVGGASSEEFDVSKICVQAGTDDTFIPSLKVVGDIELSARVAADDWTSGATQIILDNLDGFDGYRLSVTATGEINANYGDGTTARLEGSALYTLADGSAVEIKVTYDAGTGAVVWYEDGVQVDTDTATVAAGSPSDVGVYVGASDSDANHFDGSVFFIEVRDGIDGPVVARMDADDAAGAL